MRAIHEYVTQKQSALLAHPFFGQLRVDPARKDPLWFAPLSAFWVMAFQDVMRLNAERAREPSMRELMRRHTSEESGHDRWFLDDLEIIGHKDTGLPWLFSEACAQVRDATYMIAGEVLQITDDRLRVVFVLTVEAVAGVMFQRAAAYVHELGMASRLTYLSGTHVQAEVDHDIFEDDVQARMLAIDLPADVGDAARGLVDRLFAAFSLMADGLMRRE